MLYIAWMVIVSDQDIKTISFGNFNFELPRVKNCINRFRTSLLGAPPPPRTPTNQMPK